MQSLVFIIAVVSLAGSASAKDCPKIVTQKDFDVTKVSPAEP